jgi:hypothetical protein
LGDDEVPAVVHFALEVFEIARAVEALRMALGIARDADAEIMSPADEFRQAICIGESALGGDEGLPRGDRHGGQYVADPAFPQIVEHCRFRPYVRRTSGGPRRILLRSECRPIRLSWRGSALRRSPDIARMQRLKLFDGLKHCATPASVLGEELKETAGFPLPRI